MTLSANLHLDLRRKASRINNFPGYCLCGCASPRQHHVCAAGSVTSLASHAWFHARQIRPVHAQPYAGRVAVEASKDRSIVLWHPNLGKRRVHVRWVAKGNAEFLFGRVVRKTVLKILPGQAAYRRDPLSAGTEGPLDRDTLGNAWFANQDLVPVGFIP